MATGSRTVTFESINVGDELPPFVISETQETIDGARDPDHRDEAPPKNIHNDPDFAEQGIFAGTVNGGPTTMAYITQMLEAWFPASSFYDGGSLTFKAINPFRPGDTVTFTGTVSAKREQGGRRFVDCEIKGTNQDGRLIGVAEATLAINA